MHRHRTSLLIAISAAFVFGTTFAPGLTPSATPRITLQQIKELRQIDHGCRSASESEY